MRLVIFGSRGVSPTPCQISESLENVGIDESQVTELVCGMARGGDMAGLRWAGQMGLPVKKFPADWNKHGKRAGFIRNREMAEYADIGVGFWDGESKGTQNMITEMRQLGKRVEVLEWA